MQIKLGEVFCLSKLTAVNGKNSFSLGHKAPTGLVVVCLGVADRHKLAEEMEPGRFALRLAASGLEKYGLHGFDNNAFGLNANQEEGKPTKYTIKAEFEVEAESADLAALAAKRIFLTERAVELHPEIVVRDNLTFIPYFFHLTKDFDNAEGTET